jgi:hypothetical protein
LPAISRFFGVVVAMYYQDHDPPHFHVRHAGREAAVEIATLRVLEGALPNRVLGLVLEWAWLHRDALLENWSLARIGLPLLSIDPLV